jgi:hypothetical protein
MAETCGAQNLRDYSTFSNANTVLGGLFVDFITQNNSIQKLNH